MEKSQTATTQRTGIRAPRREGEGHKLYRGIGGRVAALSHARERSAARAKVDEGSLHNVCFQERVVGIRRCDIVVSLLQPAGDLLAGFHVCTGGWCTISGDSHLGRRLLGLQGQAGFQQLQVWVSCEVYTSLVRLCGDSVLVSCRCAETDFRHRVLGRGLASEERLAAVEHAWRAWLELPEAFAALPHVEVMRWRVSLGPQTTGLLPP